MRDDDAPAAILEQMRCNGTNGVAGASQVDVNGVVPIRVFPVQDRLERLDACVCEQDVEPSKSGACLLGRGTQSGKIALVKARAWDRFGMVAQERKITLDYEVETSVSSVSADRGRLLQVIGNLLGNALSNSPLRVVACRFAHSRASAVLRSPFGIPTPALPPRTCLHIFERFWRTDRGARSGAGLGLTICKGIVEAHNGQIRAESSVGVGTTFHVGIPAAQI